MSSVEIVPVTKEMMLDFYGQGFQRTIKAIAGVKDGEVLGIAGYYIDMGRAVIFSDLKPGAPKKAIVKGTRATLEMIKRAGLVGVAYRQDESAASFLEHFGFVEFAPGVYEWRG